jgi:crotonobetainyl-CoA:carnitine CoA-transferase CaiB-like acyl-CoA transferase
LQAVGPVVYFSETDPVRRGPVPEEPGQPAQAILANAGFTADAIALWRANKVVS